MKTNFSLIVMFNSQNPTQGRINLICAQLLVATLAPFISCVESDIKEVRFLYICNGAAKNAIGNGPWMKTRTVLARHRIYL